MGAEFGDGHDLEEDVSKDALPSVGDDPPSDRWDDAIEGIEEAVLSGIDGMDHGGRNSFSRLWLSIERGPEMSRRKMDIKLEYSKSYAEI